jgi:hypothetical protein
MISKLSQDFQSSHLFLANRFCKTLCSPIFQMFPNDFQFVPRIS